MARRDLRYGQPRNWKKLKGVLVSNGTFLEKMCSHIPNYDITKVKVSVPVKFIRDSSSDIIEIIFQHN